VLVEGGLATVQFLRGLEALRPTRARSESIRPAPPPMVLSDELIAVVKRGDLAALEEHMNGGGDPNERASDRDVQCTLLSFAALEGQVMAMRRLLAHGANPHLHNSYEWTPLHVAAANWQGAAVEVLLEAGAKVDVRATTGATPLMHASIRGDVRSIRALLKAGATVEDAMIKEARTLEHPEAVKLLEGARASDRMRA
jgi:ankyrin repeat protein